ncbi:MULTISPECIES: cysteine hydrolase family protein [unclassified Methylophaga]|jgi:nicotinamidase-related amidase|uniref:cysteine hydrolase family protein n=1 Tax=unclassified Methylophaga TaxID=2629249 RepID=UPI000C932673|nr:MULTISPECIES: cysteine hydrolase family protein [unclassified Methylophaga]MAP25952.1 cysteine hydrolase [Methylophaga sp.]HBX59353.1 cysteine hydrolase [Methylophaga sp.]HCN99072.1 cysteine hydrolase [Methylophaga sp.]|tara:strand:+ start:1947 stop:2549 length:603 start_codon:yes stop_codon:yes gene_type:complete
MTQASQTLRDIVGLGHQPAKLGNSALIMIDCQNTYRTGVMHLTGVEKAILEAKALLERARSLNIPIIHIQHDGGVGSPYDLTTDIGQISNEVAPQDGEYVITKNFPNAFVQTELDQRLKSLNIENIVLAGFMTHMCVNSTAHGGFNLGYKPTVVASTTATRPLQAAGGKVISAEQVQDGAIASTRDLYAAVVDRVSDLSD